MSDQLSIRKHVRFLTRHLNIFPTVYLSLDSCRPTLLFFALSGLDMLYTLDDVLTPEKKKEYIDWLYSLQLTSESGLPIPLRSPSLLPGNFSRLPGVFLNDSKDLLYGRNLLAAKRVSEGQTVKLWTVSEMSDRKLLEQMNVRVRKKGTVIVEKDEDPETAPGNTPLIDPAVELKSSRFADVYVRSRKALHIKSPYTDVLSQVYKGCVRYFEENPYLDEVLLCDYRGFVFHGSVEHKLTHVSNKSGHKTQIVTCSNHPRVCYAANENDIRLLDLRVDNPSTAMLLYSIPVWEEHQFGDPIYVPKNKYQRATFKHLLSVPGAERYILAISTHEALLLDSRMPGRSVFYLGHGIPHGGHHVFASTSVFDSEREGFVYNFHVINHLVPSFSTLSLYHHSKEIVQRSGNDSRTIRDPGMWSTLCPVWRRAEPKSYMSMAQPDTAGPDISFLFPPTRAACSMSGFEDKKGRGIEVIFRALDDGSIWSESVRHGPVDVAEESSLIRSSWREVKAYVESQRELGPIQCRALDDKLKPTYRSSTVRVKFEVDLDENALSSLGKQVYPFEMKISKADKLGNAIFSVKDPRKEFSTIVTNAWEKFSLAKPMASRRRPRASEESEAEMPDVDRPRPRPPAILDFDQTLTPDHNFAALLDATILSERRDDEREERELDVTPLPIALDRKMEQDSQDEEEEDPFAEMLGLDGDDELDDPTRLKF